MFSPLTDTCFLTAGQGGKKLEALWSKYNTFIDIKASSL